MVKVDTFKFVYWAGLDSAMNAGENSDIHMIVNFSLIQ